jgi:hypothetical protein
VREEAAAAVCSSFEAASGASPWAARSWFTSSSTRLSKPASALAAPALPSTPTTTAASAISRFSVVTVRDRTGRAWPPA